MIKKRISVTIYILITISILLGVFFFYNRGQLVTRMEMIFLCMLEAVACFCVLQAMIDKNHSIVCAMIIVGAFLFSCCYGFIKGIESGSPIEAAILLRLLSDCAIYFVAGMGVIMTWLKIKKKYPI